MAVAMVTRRNHSGARKASWWAGIPLPMPIG